MKFVELQRRGRRMDAEEITATIRALGADPRFAAVVALIENNLEDFASSGCRQEIASDPGKLAHCGGSGHALRTLLGQVITAIEQTPSGGMEKPEE